MWGLPSLSIKVSEAKEPVGRNQFFLYKDVNFIIQ